MWLLSVFVCCCLLLVLLFLMNEKLFHKDFLFYFIACCCGVTVHAMHVAASLHGHEWLKQDNEEEEEEEEEEEGVSATQQPPPSPLTHGERIFNIMACYFPITFNPPPNDPHGITPTMLIQSLKHALCDDTHVASFVIPFLLDQLLAPPETVCRSHALFYLHYLVKRHASKRDKAMDTLPLPFLLALSQLSEALYDIALEDTTSLPVFAVAHDHEADDEACPENTAVPRTLTDQAVDLIGVICKQIGTSATQGELLWSQFGEPMISEVMKNTRKSVQSLVTKANMKVALAMAGSTYKVTSTLIDRLVPVLLGHVRPVLLADIEQKASRGDQTDPPAKLLQHDLERKQHDKNSAAVGLMYVAQLLSCTLDFELSFSQYSKFTDAEDAGERDGASDLFGGLFDLLCQYTGAFFQFGNTTTVNVVDTDRSSVGLYAGCLKCLQSLVAMRLQNTPGAPCAQETSVLQQVTLNCFSVRDSAEHSDTSSYGWSADIRQASVLYVANCRSLYLQNTNLTSVAPEPAPSSAIFEEGCINVLQNELSAEPSAERLNHVFHTISYLLQPFSAGGGGGRGEGGLKGAPWSPLDNKMLSILLDCITTATTTADKASLALNVQTFALDALLNCLPRPAAPASPDVQSQNHIVTSLLTVDESSGERKTNLQKLLEFALSSRCVDIAYSMCWCAILCSMFILYLY
jgi:hypothetical protein